MFKGKKNNYKILGICSAEIQREIEKKVIFSISKYATQHGYKVMLFNTFGDMYSDLNFEIGERSVYKLVNHDLIDALIVMPATIERDDAVSEIVSDAKESGIPVFSFDQEFESCKSVHLKYADNFEKIVSHVVKDHGCKNVYMMAGMRNNSFSQERIDTYKKVLEENGIEFDENKVMYGSFWSIPAKMAMEELFKTTTVMPEAIVCANDIMAITVCQELRNHGYRIPEDVIVTGFDGAEMEKYTSPRLTTAEPDYEELGRLMIELVDKAVAGEEVPQKSEVSYFVRISESCGCKNSNPADVLEKVLELSDTIGWSEGHESYMFTYASTMGHCDDVEKIGEQMWRFADHNSWVCLNTDCFDEQREKYRYKKFFTAKMNNILTRHSKEFIGSRIFNTSQLIPDMETEFENHDCFLFMPIHHQQNVMGYYIMAFDINAKDFSNTRRFIKNTDNIIESMRNRFIVQKTTKKLEEMCVKDYLTGVYNRQGFYALMSGLIKKCKTDEKNVVMFSIDMDSMNIINNTYGHNEGDRAIVAVATALKNCATQGEIVARFGGDEFVVVGEELSENYSSDYAKRVCEEIEKFNNSDENRPYKVKISCGWVSARCNDQEDVYEKMRIADSRMYEQKRSHKAGRNTDKRGEVLWDK